MDNTSDSLTQAPTKKQIMETMSGLERLRFVLLGKSGCGINSTGNTILGKPFHSAVNVSNVHIKAPTKEQIMDNTSDSLTQAPTKKQIMETMSELPACRILLIGRIGAGKSLTGNTMLGEPLFSAVNDCNFVKSRFSARQVAEVDTPGLFGRTDDIIEDFIRKTAAFRSYKVMDTPGLADTHDDNVILVEEIKKSVFAMHPGPHALLLVLRGIDRFTNEEFQVYQALTNLFGAQLSSYMIVVFTHVNAKEEYVKTIEDKVIDTPGVFDTHRTKKDVYSKTPQKDWREGIFNLRRKHLLVHQVIILFLFTISFAQGISSHCETNHTMNCTDLFLTCSFDTDIIQLAKSLYMNHEQNNSMDLEIILVCQTSSKGFHCETSPTYEFVSVESNRLTVKIPEVNLKHVGKYWCNVQGFVDSDQKVCELSLPDNFEQENGPQCKEYRSSPATIAIIVLSSSLVLAGTSLILFLLYIFSKHQIHYATRFNLKRCKSEIRTNNKHEEACELL